MTPLLFSISIVILFGLLFAYEASTDSTQPQLRQFGLLTWLISGNWPAKVGAGLLILGVGALLRYVLINFEAPPELKIGGGLFIAGILGAASYALKNRPARRAIHLALAGSAFGVAYLTAYSAYDIFKYIDQIGAMSLFTLVAAAAGTFAVLSNAMSVGVLAMAGAYLAPAFALGNAEPLPVFGYYVVVSVLSLVMVTMRGWRALIHLSFLFTLGGALFFGWTREFFRPEYYSYMQPLLFALSAIHLAMPLVERRHIPSAWLARFDMAYFVALPLAAAAATLLIAPDRRADASIGLIGLALIWAAAAILLKALQRDEVARHSIVALLFVVGAVACRVQDLPWSIVGLVIAVAALAVAPRLGWSRTIEELACGAMFMCALLFVATTSLSGEEMERRFLLNELFAKRFVTIVLLTTGAWIAHRRSIEYAKVLWAVAGTLTLVTFTAEIRLIHLELRGQFTYSLLMIAVIANAVYNRRRNASRFISGFLVLAVPLVGWYSSQKAMDGFIIASLFVTPLVLLFMAWPSKERSTHDDFPGMMALAILPIAVMPWANGTASALGIDTNFFEGTIFMGCVIVAAALGNKWMSYNQRWNETIQPLYFLFTSAFLAAVAAFHIERGIWPVAFEVLAIVYLVIFTAIKRRQGAPSVVVHGTIAVIAAGLVLQAMLLRVLGPDHVMTAADLLRMKLRAVVSLMWACFGAGLTWWGTKASSRTVWSAGATLLAIAAAKLVLFDFGSLGQLTNIIALIAAGLLFLGVAWLAPMPAKTLPAIDESTDEEHHDDGAPDERRQSVSTNHTETTGAADKTVVESRVAAPSVESPKDNLTTPAQPRESASATAKRHGSRTSGVWLGYMIVSIGLVVVVPLIAWKEHARKKQVITSLHEEMLQTPRVQTGAQPPQIAATVPMDERHAYIEQMMRTGMIRAATDADIAEVVKEFEGRAKVTQENGSPALSLKDTYIVLNQLEFPPAPGYFSSLIFIIPRSVPYPQGDLRDVTLYDMNTLRCMGRECL